MFEVNGKCERERCVGSANLLSLLGSGDVSRLLLYKSCCTA